MAVKKTQECDFCGRTREVPWSRNDDDALREGGWNVIKNGARTLHACIGCTSKMVDWAQGAVVDKIEWVR